MPLLRRSGNISARRSQVQREQPGSPRSLGLGRPNYTLVRDKQTFGSPISPLLPAIPPSKDVDAKSGEASAEKDEGAGFRDSNVVIAIVVIAILVILRRP